VCVYVVRILVEKGIAPYMSYDFCYVPLTTAPILYCIVVTIMYCIIFHTMLYIPVLLLLNKKNKKINFHSCVCVCVRERERERKREKERERE